MKILVQKLFSKEGLDSFGEEVLRTKLVLMIPSLIDYNFYSMSEEWGTLTLVVTIGDYEVYFDHNLPKTILGFMDVIDELNEKVERVKSEFISGILSENFIIQQLLSKTMFVLGRVDYQRQLGAAPKELLGYTRFELIMKVVKEYDPTID